MRRGTSQAKREEPRGAAWVAARNPVYDFYFWRPVDNSSLIRAVDPQRRRQYWRFLKISVVVFLCVLIYAWQYFACLRLRREMSFLKSEHQVLSEWQYKLRLERASLARLERIEAIAGRELGLQRAEPAQFRFPRREAAVADGTTWARNVPVRPGAEFSELTEEVVR